MVFQLVDGGRALLSLKPSLFSHIFSRTGLIPTSTELQDGSRVASATATAPLSPCLPRRRYRKLLCKASSSSTGTVRDLLVPR